MHTDGRGREEDMPPRTQKGTEVVYECGIFVALLLSGEKADAPLVAIGDYTVHIHVLARPQSNPQRALDMIDKIDKIEQKAIP